jgi:hypothetical protein
MRIPRNYSILRKIVWLGFFMVLANFSMAQLNTVEFGKNRVQYKKLKWRYYQTKTSMYTSVRMD